MKRITYARLAVLMLAAAGLALQGCGGDDERVRVETVEVPVEVPADPEIVEVPVEVPDSSGLEGVQQRAADAAMAAKMASDDAAADAKAAMDATANVATMQTGEMSMMMAYEAKKAADAAMKAYMTAKAASDAAAVATTTEAATEEAVKAEAAQADAEMYAMTADEKSMGAAKYAMTELMIDGTMKSAGDSSIDASMGMLTTTNDDGSKTITGSLDGMHPMRTTAMRDGQAYDQVGDAATAPADDTDNAVAVPYKQAVAAGSITIGKRLDTSDNMARLTLITSYEGDKKVRVFTNTTDATAGLDNLIDATTNSGLVATADDVTLRSVGLYYEATNTADTDNEELDAMDAVTPGADGVELFILSGVVNPTADPVVRETGYVRITDTTTDATGMVTARTYQSVDVMAVAAPDVPGDDDLNPEQVKVMATIPAAIMYDHLHFGVWASIGEGDDGDMMQMPTDLGIGFVQSIGDGITQKQGIGTATFNGDWVAAIQRAHGEGEGSIVVDDGKAMLTADFNEDKFTGMLDGLATLSGTLSGNGFSGMKATVADNEYGLTAGGAFSGMFEGGIYGEDGEEAGGIFDFSSETDGAFRGAFGAHRDGN